MVDAAKPTPPGVVVVLIDPTGRAVVSANDFETSTPGGLSLKDAQRHRARIGLANALVDHYFADFIGKTFGTYEREEIIRKLVSQQKYTVHIEYIGHAESAK